MPNRIYILTGSLHEKKLIKLLEYIGDNKSKISGILIGSKNNQSIFKKVSFRLTSFFDKVFFASLMGRLFDLIPIKNVQNSWGQKGMNSWDLLETQFNHVSHFHGVNIIHDFSISAAGFRSLGDIDDKVYVVAFTGGFFDDEILSIDNLVLLNAHMGKMPTYRGMAVIEWAVLNGETPYATAMKIAPVIDGGDVFLEKAIDIKEVDSHSELRKVGYEACLKLMAELLILISQNSQISRIQEGKGKYYYRMHSKLLSQVSGRFQKK